MKGLINKVFIYIQYCTKQLLNVTRYNNTRTRYSMSISLHGRKKQFQLREEKVIENQIYFNKNKSTMSEAVEMANTWQELFVNTN